MVLRKHNGIARTSASYDAPPLGGAPDVISPAPLVVAQNAFARAQKPVALVSVSVFAAAAHHQDAITPATGDGESRTRTVRTTSPVAA